MNRLKAGDSVTFDLGKSAMRRSDLRTGLVIQDLTSTDEYLIQCSDDQRRYVVPGRWVYAKAALKHRPGGPKVTPSDEGIQVGESLAIIRRGPDGIEEKLL